MQPRQIQLGDLVTDEQIREAVNRKQRKKSRGATAAEEFAFQCRAYKLPPFMSAPNECFFALKHNGRQWRFDFAWPEYMVAVEIEGLVIRKVNGQVQMGGRHATITGFREDCDKYNCAAYLGWYVLRFEQNLVAKGKVIDEVQRMLVNRGWTGPA